MDQVLQALQKVLHHRFTEVKYLQTALTHSSYANEQPDSDEHNERLEFLGDAVLELCISRILFAKFPDEREGQLTHLRAKLVSEPALARLAREIGLNEYIMLGRGEESQGGRDKDSILSDSLEAIFGAVFLDGGYDTAEKVIAGLLEKHIPDLPSKPKVKDPKSKLQELTQRLYKARPVYTLTDSTGPEHAKVFHVRITLPDERSLVAQGHSMKKAEQNAAAKALEMLEAETK